MAINTFTIYIKLIDEAVYVIRPTKGKMIRDLIFEVLPTDNYDPNDENWEFLPGMIVKCKREYSISIGREILVAVEVVID